jgi:hypothetical protein
MALRKGCKFKYLEAFSAAGGTAENSIETAELIRLIGDLQRNRQPVDDRRAAHAEQPLGARSAPPPPVHPR